jgi:hypothetical protein
MTYTFTIGAQATFPANFTFVGLNVKHINIDGSEGTPNGTALGYRTNTEQSFTYSSYGCRPKIQIKRDYALSGKSCTITETIEGRTSFVIPAPTMFLPNGNCIAPPL